MNHRPAWTTAFLGVTAAAVTMELLAAYGNRDRMQPWCAYLTYYVPRPIGIGASIALALWLPRHIIEAYRKADKA